MNDRLLLVQKQSPGDLIVLSGAIRDLHLSHPMKYHTNVFSFYPEVFYRNHFTNGFPKDLSHTEIELDTGPYIHKYRKEGYHYSDLFRLVLEEKLGVHIEKSNIAGNLFFSNMELEQDLPELTNEIGGPYWLINVGIKNDKPLKQYPPILWQRVVDLLVKSEKFKKFKLVQVGDDRHMHPVLENVVDMVGKTNSLRDYFLLCRNAYGMIGHVSMQMHVAGVFHKPCVVVAGGREEPSWESYSNHVYFNSIGRLDCCRKDGCWRSHLNECDSIKNGKMFPECMSMIMPEDVVESILSYI